MSSDNSGKASFICSNINFVETYPEVLSELTRWLKKRVVLTEMLIKERDCEEKSIKCYLQTFLHSLTCLVLLRSCILGPIHWICVICGKTI